MAVFASALLGIVLVVPWSAGGDHPTPEELLRGLAQKYKQGDKKLEALVIKVDKAVRKALATTPMPGAAGATPRFLDSHPYLALVNELTAQAKAEAGKTGPWASELLARYPWQKELELIEGLQYGSDRPIPENENGFVELGALPCPHPGFPELCVNPYLWGLHELVGWRRCVDEKKTLAFRARTAKDPAPGLESALPCWEALQTYLSGSLPEVSLFALPRLTHLIHARLAERRRAGGRLAPMDELLGLLDARWNAFTFETPYSKTRTAIALPVFGLIADRKSFVYRFPIGAQLAASSDIPFVSDLTMQKYAQVFRNESFDIGEFIGNAPGASAARNAFWQDCVYLGRYRALVETCARALLAPSFALPCSLDVYDFAGGAAPSERAAAGTLDVPRKHALVLWAFAGLDPLVLADFLHDNLLDLELDRFPKNVSLHTEFGYSVRKRDAELLAAITARVSREPAGDYAREFSPYATALDPASAAATGFLVDSYQAFHAPVVNAIRDAAYAVVTAELEK